MEVALLVIVRVPPGGGRCHADEEGVVSRRISKVPRVPQNQYGTSVWSRGISMVSRFSRSPVPLDREGLMRRPVTVFAWIRHQQAIGYEVATRQQEVADRLLLPPARGAAEASQLNIRPGSALPPYGTHAGVAGSRNIPHAFMLMLCGIGHARSPDPVTSRMPSRAGAVCRV